jgi:hypothetical protein
MKKILKSKLFWIVVVVAAIFGGYYYMTPSNENVDQVDVTDSVEIVAPDTAVVTEVVDSLNTQNANE